MPGIAAANSKTAKANLKSSAVIFILVIILTYIIIFRTYIDKDSSGQNSVHSKDISLSRAIFAENKNPELEQRINHVIDGNVITGSISISTPSELNSVAENSVPSWVPTSQPTMTPSSSISKSVIFDPQLLNGLSLHSKCSFNPASSDLVIGIATNIDPKNFAIFAGSLRAVNVNTASIIIINTPVSNHIESLAMKYKITLVEYELSQLYPSFIHSYHPSSLRWIIMNRILSLPTKQFFPTQPPEFISNQFKRIITLDIRDSAFQVDPFKLFDFDSGGSSSDNKLWVFGEDKYNPIENCGWNSGWIKDCFHPRIYTSVKDQPIICSGVLVGHSGPLKTYLHIMSSILLGEQLSELNEKFRDLKGSLTNFPSSERNGVDQGVHNVIVHLGLVGAQHLNGIMSGQVIVKYPDTFPVVNLQAVLDSMLVPVDSLFQNGQLSFPGNSKLPLYAIVHQYDRVSKLQLAYGKRYVDWIDWKNTLKSEWSELCSSNFEYVENVDILRGECDKGSIRAMTAASCCAMCLQRSAVSSWEELENYKGDKTICTGFAYANGACYFKNCDKKKVQRRANEFNDKKSGMGNSFTTAEDSGVMSGYLKFTH